jgi:hypothetical protein
MRTSTAAAWEPASPSARAEPIASTEGGSGTDHGSRPVMPSSATKYRTPSAAARSDGVDDEGPGARSCTSTVPASVPSLVQSSTPVAGWYAAKYRRPLATASAAGTEPPGPGTMSFTITVPAVVPSVRHSSTPCATSLAAK